jgi:hypothetical protein
MPKLIVAGDKSKTPGRKFMQYDPTVAGDLPSKELQALYDKQSASLKKHNADVAEFTTAMIGHIKAGGATFDPVVLLNYGKVAVAIDDGKSKKSAPTVPGSAVDWVKASVAMQA